MNKTTKKCNDCGACSHVDGKVTAMETPIADTKHTGEKETLDYGFYSNVLKKPFERLDDLKKAEYVYYEELKAKEDKAAQKRADAHLVEEAFKALNKARKVYKEAKTNIATVYAEDLKQLKADFETDNKLLNDALAEAEELYASALNTFIEKYPEGYHLTLKDGDFETTISSSTAKSGLVEDSTAVKNILELLFGF